MSGTGVSNISLTASPDYATQMAQLQRQQALALALQQQAQQDIPVSGSGNMAAPIPYTAVLAKTLAGLGSAFASRKADSERTQLTKRQQQDALTALQNFGRNPDTINQAADPFNNMAGLDQTSAAPVGSTIAGAPTSLAQRQQMLPQLAMQATDNPYLKTAFPFMQDQTKVDIRAIGPEGLAQIGPDGSVKQVVPGKAPPLDDSEKKAEALYGPDYKTNPEYLAYLRRELLHIKSPEQLTQDLKVARENRAIIMDSQKGAGVSPDDPTVANYAKSIHSGLIQLRSIPMVYRNAVSNYLANETDQTGSPTTAALWAGAATKITNPYTKNPQYELFASAQPYLQRMNAAAQMKSSIGDTDILDSLVKLETGGNAITEAQVRTTVDGKSVADSLDILKNKLVSQGGVLSDQQRKEALDLGKKIYSNYKTGYKPLYDMASKQLSAANIPKAYWTIPDLDELGPQMPSPGGSADSAQTKTIGGVTYTKQPNGTWTHP